MRGKARDLKDFWPLLKGPFETPAAEIYTVGMPLHCDRSPFEPGFSGLVLTFFFHFLTT